MVKCNIIGCPGHADDRDFCNQVMLRDLRNHFVVCVLSGNWPGNAPERGVTYVKTLQAMVRAQAPVPFICFTDREIPGVVTRYLPPWLPGWWGKLYAFAPSNFPLGSRVLVLDLDTVVAGSLDDILSVPLDKPVFIRDAWFNQHAGSGMFMFETSRETARIWTDFPHATKGPPFLGRDGKPMATDEQWIHQYIYKEMGWRDWNEVVPGQVLSYKHHLHQSFEPLPPDCRVVYFDGHPRPHTVKAPWNPHDC